MNDEARAILTQAWLQGHPQIKGAMHSDDGDCAVGVLHLAIHGTRREARTCHSAECLRFLARRFELRERWCLEHPDQLDALWHRNDEHDEDFLTLARKFEVEDGALDG